jgi:transcriptional regulator with XRE-family HTH domain
MKGQPMTERQPSTTFATRLAVLRGEKRMTVQELAMQAGIHRQLVHKLERSEHEPTWATVQKLADALGVPTDAFRVKQDRRC